MSAAPFRSIHAFHLQGHPSVLRLFLPDHKHFSMTAAMVHYSIVFPAPSIRNMRMYQECVFPLRLLEHATPPVQNDLPAKT